MFSNKAQPFQDFFGQLWNILFRHNTPWDFFNLPINDVQFRVFDSSFFDGALF